MALGIDRFTLGVEEEYQIVDAESLALVSRQDAVLPVAERALGDAVQPELQRSMVEIATPVCASLADVRAELVRARTATIAAARERGCELVAAGTHPFSSWRDQRIAEKARYREIAATYGLIARETMICGCHVHVAIESRALAIDVMNRVRTRLAPLLALAANSPFWLGEDSGYASFRTEVWSRWPLSGPPLAFAGEREYDATIAALVASGLIEDETKLYWDVRPSCRFPTLEFRVADVATTIDEAALFAGLARAIARTEYLAAVRGEPVHEARHEVVRAAHWHAARYGLTRDLVDGRSGERVPAREAIGALLADVSDALDEAGDYDEVAALLERTLARGNGASRQRAAYAERGEIRDVVRMLVAETAGGR